MNDAMALAGLMTGVIGGGLLSYKHPYTGGLAPLFASRKRHATPGGSEIVSKPWLSSTPIALLLASVLERRLGV